MAQNNPSDVLQTEHELLGAQFSSPDDSIYQQVVAYPWEESYRMEDGALDYSSALSSFAAGLVDLSGASALYLHGSQAEQFIDLLCAGKKLTVGEISFEPILSAESNFMSLSLALRCGDHEYVLLDSSPRAALQEAWVRTLAVSCDQKSHPLFCDLHCENASESLIPLALFGPQAKEILSDYCERDLLPNKGEIVSLKLDNFDCLVACIDSFGESAYSPFYLVFVYPAYARRLWRSFLSFQDLTPVSIPLFCRALFAFCAHSDTLRHILLDCNLVSAQMFKQETQLRALVRPECDFIGYRAFSSPMI